MSDVSDRFRQMADKIDLNDEKSFGGCFVIVPPKEAGDAVETLILDNQQDPAQFWGLLRAKAEIALATLDEKARMPVGWQGRI